MLAISRICQATMPSNGSKAWDPKQVASPGSVAAKAVHFEPCQQALGEGQVKQALQAQVPNGQCCGQQLLQLLKDLLFASRASCHLCILDLDCCS